VQFRTLAWVRDDHAINVKATQKWKEPGRKQPANLDLTVDPVPAASSVVKRSQSTANMGKSEAPESIQLLFLLFPRAIGPAAQLLASRKFASGTARDLLIATALTW